MVRIPRRRFFSGCVVTVLGTLLSGCASDSETTTPVEKELRIELFNRGTEPHTVRFEFYGNQTQDSPTTGSENLIASGTDDLAASDGNAVVDSEYEFEVASAGDYLLRAKRDDGEWFRAWFESMDEVEDEMIIKVDDSRDVDILAEVVSGNQDADSADESNGG